MKNVLFGAFLCLFLIFSLGIAHGATTPGSLKWSYATGSLINSSPAIGADGTIYVTSVTGTFYALNSNGTLKWSYYIHGNTSNINSSPAIGADGTIYVGSGDGTFYALNSNGTLKWSYGTSGEMDSTIAIGSDGTIYVTSEGGILNALNSDGTLKWSYTTGGIIFSSPAIGSDGTIYVDTMEGLNALNPDGTLKWLLSTGYVISSPAIGSDGTIYVGSDESIFYAINPDGTLKWSYAAGGAIALSSSAINTDGAICVGSYDGHFYSLNPNGTLKWSYLTGLSISSSPAIGADGIIYVGSDDGHLYAFNPDGTIKWSYIIGSTAGNYSSPAIGVDGTIYVGSWANGNLYAINSSSMGLATSSWPMFHHDLKHTGLATPTPPTLTVTNSGTGSGTVTSTPSGINCGTTCSAIYSSGPSVTLTATPASGSTFTGWSGACENASGTCVIAMFAAETVTAHYIIKDIPTFRDVSNTSVYETYIEAIYNNGITTGCGNGDYCPSAQVTRDEMAAFLVRATQVAAGQSTVNFTCNGGVAGASVRCAGTIPYFLDVPATDAFFPYVQKLYELGITTGCGNENYCPSDDVTRDEMAAFLVRGTQVAAGQSTVNFTCNGGVAGASVRCAGTIPYFLDVPATDAFFPYVQKLYELGITTGCGNGNYCPSDDVTRDEMAAFLARAFLGMH